MKLLEEKQAAMIFLDEDEVFSADDIRQSMIHDPEARRSVIIREVIEEEHVVVIEEWADLPVVDLPYESIDLVFNHKNIWGNLGSSRPGRIFYDLENSNRWAPFVDPGFFSPEENELDEHGAFKPFYDPRAILPPAASDDKLKVMEDDIRKDLVLAIQNTRDEKGLPTEINEDITSQMKTCLARLEQYYCDRLDVSRNGFVSAKIRLQAACPPGHSYKGRMVNLCYTDPKAIRKYMLDNIKYFDEKGEGAKFGVAAKAVGYPMSITATWIMVAVMVPKVAK